MATVMGIINLSQQSPAYGKYVAHRNHRLTQIFWGFEALLISFSLINFLSGKHLISSVLLLCCIPVSAVYFLLKRDKIELGSTTLFSLMLIISFGLMWTFYGLRDISIMSVPVLLIFTAFLAKARVFDTLLILSIINVFAIGFVNFTGIYNHPEPNNTLASAISWSVLVIFLTASIRLLGLDLQRMSRRLSRQNKKVSVSRAKVQYLADHDLLTDLPNQVSAEKRLVKSIFSHQQEEHDCLMLLDLDNVKRINDSMGHNFGDKYIIEISQRLNNTVASNGDLYHIGGDEFLIIIEATNDTFIKNLVIRIQDTLHASHSISEIDVKSTTSIGIAIAHHSNQTFEDLRLQATMALDQVKTNGGNNYLYHNAKLDENALELAQLKNDLKNAINNDELSIAFQPKISLNDKKIIGAEALICWNHPTFGFINQNEFLLLVKKSGLDFDIGDWIISNACNACNHWVSLGHAIPVALSTSIIEFSSGRIIESVERNLMFTNLNGQHLELQVAEALFIEKSPNLFSTLTILKAMGITISIENFGTGYSNLSNLKNYDIDALKIGKSFVSNIDDDYDNAIVRAIINIAKSLDIKVIAEGISSKEAVATLTDMNSDIGQGCYWSQPLDEDTFIEYLQAEKMTQLQS